MARTYCIMPTPQPPEAWEFTLEKRPIRLSVDESLVVMKWQGETPAYFAGVQTYSHAEIKAILSGPEWTEPDPEPEGEP